MRLIVSSKIMWRLEGQILKTRLWIQTQRRLLFFRKRSVKFVATVQKRVALIDGSLNKVVGVLGTLQRACSTDVAARGATNTDSIHPLVDINCSGCGVRLQSQNEEKTGYIPSDKMEDLLQHRDFSAICRRCFQLRHYNECLNVTLDEDDYKCHLQHLKHQKALILCIVDVTDFPCSIFPNLVDVIGYRNPVAIVGNKIDMLTAKDDTQRRVKESVHRGCVEAGLDRTNIVGIHLVSAKTGVGINALVKDLTDNWGKRGDIYMLGSTNVGKSSLFNWLLKLLCDIPVGEIGGATISRWPGTTLGLVSFPIASRSKRERMKKKLYLQETKVGDRTNTWFMNDYKDRQKFEQNQESVCKASDNEATTMTRKKNRVYDTPGAVNPLQLINHLNHEELRYITQAKQLKPKTFILKPKQCLMIGGLAKLDYAKGSRSIYFTVFRSSLLPVHTTWVERSETFYQNHAGEKLLKIPIGGKTRMETFPPLDSRPIDVEGIGWKESAVDVVLSSAGWVAITAGEGDKVQLTAHTPNGKGIFVRSPAMLPSAVNDRGKRSKLGLRTEFLGK